MICIIEAFTAYLLFNELFQLFQSFRSIWSFKSILVPIVIYFSLFGGCLGAGFLVRNGQAKATAQVNTIRVNKMQINYLGKSWSWLIASGNLAQFQKYIGSALIEYCLKSSLAQQESRGEFPTVSNTSHNTIFLITNRSINHVQL